MMCKIETAFFKKGYRITNDGSIINPNGKKLSGYIHNNGYIRINSKKNNKTIECYVHRMQAFQKYGMDLYENKIVVRHKDGNKLNNSFDNILIGTYSDNRMDIPEHIRIKMSLYAASFKIKYNYLDVQNFHKKNGNSYKKTMEKFSITSKGTLHNILKKDI